MKKLLLLIILAFTLTANAQDENTSVTLIVTGSGNSKDDARKTALRSAIELAYTSYVSSKTEILNDNIVKDEIITVASGNILGYKLIEEATIDGVFHNTMEVSVSVNKLVSFAQSKGVTVEFSGSLFGAEIKLQKINEQAESKAVVNICLVFDQLLRKCFDYKIEVSEPQIDQESYLINYKITSSTNQNYSTAIQYLISNLKSISMNSSEIEKYNKTRKVVYRIGFLDNKLMQDQLEKSTARQDYNGDHSFTFSDYLRKAEAGLDPRQANQENTLGGRKLENIQNYIYLRNKESVITLLNLFIKANRYPFMFRVENNIEKETPNLKKWSSEKNSFPFCLIGSRKQFAGSTFQSTKNTFDFLFQSVDSLFGNYLVGGEKYFSGVKEDYIQYFKNQNKLGMVQRLEYHNPEKDRVRIPDYGLFIQPKQDDYCNSLFPSANPNCLVQDVLLISELSRYSFISEYKARYTLEDIEKISKIEVIPIIEN
jgi:hypothetical protein